MRSMRHLRNAAGRLVLVLGAALAFGAAAPASWAQAPQPSMLVPGLGVRPVVSDLVTPITMAFLAPNDLLVLEKNTGRVVRVTNGVSQGAVLDLGVNFASERGLLGIALHPEFPEVPHVFLFWTARSTSPPSNPFAPDERVPLDANMFAGDTDDVLMVPLLGNRVDRFTWNGSTLTYDRNLIFLRSFQNDAAPQPPGQGDETQPPRGNHNGGVLAFGPDGKLYIYFGDQGRRGQLQNLPSGPTSTGLGPVVPDDQFGGPAPDDAHLAGVILRLETDGSAPPDNPFYRAGSRIGGEVGANLQKVFAYGLRNSFGMAFDPLSGSLWEADHGEDAFDEINRIVAGMNGGWIQVQGPLSRVEEYRAIETTSLHNELFPNLQQLRWGPENIAERPAEARHRLFRIPGSHYQDPQLSFKHVLPPAALGFVEGTALGEEFEGRMLWGSAVGFPLGGALFGARLNAQRTRLAVEDPRLRDRVVDNATFDDTTEAESLLVGRDFGVLTDIETGPNGNLFVVSLSQGTVYEIFRDAGTRAAASPRAAAGASRSPSLRAAGVVHAGRSAMIQYELPTRGRVDVAVFDVLGRRVATLAQGDVEAGRRIVSWSGVVRGGRPAASGVYFVRLETTDGTGARVQKSQKITVLH